MVQQILMDLKFAFKCACDLAYLSDPCAHSGKLKGNGSSLQQLCLSCKWKKGVVLQEE